MRSVIRTLTGYAQNAHKTGISSLRRTRLARSGFTVHPIKKRMFESTAAALVPEKGERAARDRGRYARSAHPPEAARRELPPCR